MRTNSAVLAVVVILLGVAAFGAGSASAVTKLCRDTSTPCSNPYLMGTVFTGSGFANFSATTACSSSAIKFKTTATMGTPLTTEVSSLTFGLCSNSCSVLAKNLSWMMPIQVTGIGPNGTGKMLNGIGGSPEFELSGCVSPPCAYAGSVPEFITGAAVATFKSSGGVLTRISGSGCPASLNLSMAHEVPGIGAGNGLFVSE